MRAHRRTHAPMDHEEITTSLVRTTILRNRVQSHPEDVLRTYPQYNPYSRFSLMFSTSSTHTGTISRGTTALP